MISERVQSCGIRHGIVRKRRPSKVRIHFSQLLFGQVFYNDNRRIMYRNDVVPSCWTSFYPTDPDCSIKKEVSSQAGEFHIVPDCSGLVSLSGRGEQKKNKMEGDFKVDEGDTSGDTLTSQERMISESPVMWPDCKEALSDCIMNLVTN